MNKSAENGFYSEQDDYWMVNITYNKGILQCESSLTIQSASYE
jgi:hypothetical protein